MKTVGLKIEIDGLSDITKEVVKLETELKDLNAQLKETEVGSDAYIELRNQVALTTESLKAAKKEQKDFIKSAEATKDAEGSYYQLNQQLVDLKKQYKSLSQAERESAEGQELQKKIQGLDKELKKIDAGIGQFQRNVGNYPKGIGKIIKGLEEVIPGFKEFSAGLRDAEGNLNLFGKALIGGFVAFQSAKLIGQAIKALDEFVSKINETRETVAEFSGAYGEDLDRVTAQTTALANTFDTDAQTISEAAAALSAQLGIGFEEALSKLEGTLIEGQGNADDYLKTITEYPEAFQDATGEITEFSERNKQLVSTNKELAASQVDVAKRLQGFVDGAKNLGNTLMTGLLSILADVLDFLTPIANGIGFLVGKFFEFSDAIRNVVLELPIIKQLFEGLQAGAKILYDAFQNMPFIFAGVVEAIKQLGKNFVDFFKVLALDAQIFGNQIKEFFGANVDAAIEELRRRRASITDEGRTVGKAFADGFNKAKAQADADAALKERAEREKQAAALKKISNKELAERAKAQRDAAETIAKEREKYSQQELEQARNRAALLADLQAKVIDQTIKNIQDARTKEIAEIENGFTKQVEAYKANYDKLVQEGKAREAELVKIFGANSKEVLAAREALSKDLIQIQAQQNLIIAQLEKTKNDDIAKVNDAYRKTELEKAKAAAEEARAFRDMILSDELNYIDQVAQLRESANEEALNKLLAQEADAKKREQAVRLALEQETLNKLADARVKLRALDDQEQFLKSQAAQNVEIKQEEYDAILKARQELNTEISALELEQTERVRQEAEKQKALRLQGIEKTAGYIQEGIGYLDQFLDAANARQEKQIADRQAASEERQSALQSEIENATGLRKRFLEQQLAQEVAAAEQLAKEQERIQRNAAKVDKGIALTQSLIQGFLAVSRAAASAPPPLNIPAIVAASVTAATQTALIAAQPLADGGAVSPVVLPDSGGRVVAAKNIPTTSKGDNVLVAARVGETFLNARQTNMLRPHLAAARIPGFATGGLVGAPNVSGITSQEANARRLLNEAIRDQAINTRVVLVTDDLDRDNREKTSIEKKVILR